jgi:hypothetical protein
MPAYVDSIDKIVFSYFAAVASEPFDYKGVTISPKPLSVSASIFRGFTCPEGCGGCCPRFSLDYLPSEALPVGVVERIITFASRRVQIFSDLQLENSGHHCKHLVHKTGRCGVHVLAAGPGQPFSCDFELIRTHMSSSADPNRLGQQLFGRGWKFLRVDGGRGALCEMTPANRDSTSEVVRKLKRLYGWANHFGLRTCLPSIIDWAESGPHEVARLFNTVCMPSKKLRLFEG